MRGLVARGLHVQTPRARYSAYRNWRMSSILPVQNINLVCDVYEWFRSFFGEPLDIKAGRADKEKVVDETARYEVWISKQHIKKISELGVPKLIYANLIKRYE